MPAPLRLHHTGSGGRVTHRSALRPWQGRGKVAAARRIPYRDAPATGATGPPPRNLDGQPPAATEPSGPVGPAHHSHAHLFSPDGAAWSSAPGQDSHEWLSCPPCEGRQLRRSGFHASPARSGSSQRLALADAQQFPRSRSPVASCIIIPESGPYYSKGEKRSSRTRRRNRRRTGVLLQRNGHFGQTRRELRVPQIGAPNGVSKSSAQNEPMQLIGACGAGHLQRVRRSRLSGSG